MSDNWIVQNLNSALSTWSEKMAELWTLLTENPATFKGGGIWRIMVNINDALTAIAYGLLVLFFAAGIIKTCGSFTDLKKPEHVLKAFIRFALAQGAITYGMELMQALFSIVQGIVTTVMSGSSMAGSVTELPTEIVDKIESVGMLESIPLWIVTLLGSLLITVLSFVMILTVYGRMFKIYMYTAIAPIPISSFAGEPTQSIGKNFNNNFSAIVPYDMELQRKETKEMLDDLTTRDQRMMFGILTMVHLADSKKQLDSDTELLLSIARKHLCQMATLKWQQVDGLNTVLPYGLRKINALRTLTTESTAVLIPFHTQEILQPGGIYYGQNAVSKNLLVADRKKLMNGNSFRLGVSGSGKSFSAKEEIVHLALSTDDDILILDPESEFTKLVEALGGQVVKVSATSDNHLNAMDMDAAYGNEKNPLIEKSEFILSVFEQLVGAGNLSAKEKSILDRCAADVYRDYIRSGYTGEVPTLKDMYRQLMLQPEEEARGLALSSELFINGSLNTFAQPTNVNKKNRIMDYDIRELGEQLMPLGMLVTLDSIFNRVIQNWKEGKTTWIFADEFYLLFRYEYSANFFYRLYKRIRKYNGFVTGLTQNVEELLKSDTARLMLANSEFLILLNQASTDREELAALLNISENQLSYITNVSVGSGLIRCSGNIVPFENTFPKNTDLYKLMTTKPGES